RRRSSQDGNVSQLAGNLQSDAGQQLEMKSDFVASVLTAVNPLAWCGYTARWMRGLPLAVLEPFLSSPMARAVAGLTRPRMHRTFAANRKQRNGAGRRWLLHPLARSDSQTSLRELRAEPDETLRRSRNAGCD